MDCEDAIEIEKAKTLNLTLKLILTQVICDFSISPESSQATSHYVLILT